MTTPYPDTLRVRTADNVGIGYPIAGLGTRMMAQLIDGLVVGIIIFVVIVVGTALAASASSATGGAFAVAAGVLSGVLVFIAYFAISEAASGGRTLGKSALHIRVIRIDGGAPDTTAVLIRNVARLVDNVTIGVVWMFFHPLSRRLGDILAGTVVVRDQPEITLAAATSPPPVILHIRDPGSPIAGVDQLGDEEHRAIRIFLERTGLSPDQRHRLAAAIALRLYERLELTTDSPERGVHPELFLERVYLQLQPRLGW